jgi:hypothetical protein
VWGIPLRWIRCHQVGTCIITFLDRYFFPNRERWKPNKFSVSFWFYPLKLNINYAPSFSQNKLTYLFILCIVSFPKASVQLYCSTWHEKPKRNPYRSVKSFVLVEINKHLITTKGWNLHNELSRPYHFPELLDGSFSYVEHPLAPPPIKALSVNTFMMPTLKNIWTLKLIAFTQSYLNPN